MVGSEEASCQSILVRQIDSSQTRPPIIARRSILSHKTYRNGSLETEAEVIWVASRVASSGSVNRALDWQYGGIEWNLCLGYLVRSKYCIAKREEKKMCDNKGLTFPFVFVFFFIYFYAFESQFFFSNILRNVSHYQFNLFFFILLIYVFYVRQ